MKVFAPGKFVLAGAYAVLEGAPAIALAVNRGAIADSSRGATTMTPEVLAAFGSAAQAPHVDASALFVEGRKLGLGASAAILVASLAVREAAAGSDLSDPVCRERICQRARVAHAEAQGGGSGVDVAASVYGGAIEYAMSAPVKRVVLPDGLGVHLLALGKSARTTELRGAVDALRMRDPRRHRDCLAELVSIANEATSAVARGDGVAFVEMLRRTARSLWRLGQAAGIVIVPDGFDTLEVIAAREGASFSVAGAGGGDVAVFVGPTPPSTAFVERAAMLRLTPLDLETDRGGVRVAGPFDALPSSPHATPVHEHSRPLPSES